MAATLTQTVSSSRRTVNLVNELAITQFKLKYTGSVLGYLWSLLNPLMTFAIMYFVFAIIFQVGKGTPDFPMQLLLAIVIWTFFSECTGNTMNAVAGNGALIKKAYFPRWILVISSTLSSLITLLINTTLVVIVGFVIQHFTGKPTITLTWESLLIPIYLIELYVFSIGMALFLSALFVFFRDVGQIWNVFTQLLMYASGVVYPISRLLKEKNKVLVDIVGVNPMDQIIEDLRHLVITPTAPLMTNVLNELYFVPFLFTLIAFGVGWFTFQKLSTRFAEFL